MKFYQCKGLCDSFTKLDESDYKPYQTKYGGYVCEKCLQFYKQEGKPSFVIQTGAVSHDFFSNINTTARAYVTAFIHATKLQNKETQLKIICKTPMLLYLRSLLDINLPITFTNGVGSICILDEKSKSDFQQTYILTEGLASDSIRGYYDAVGSCKFDNGFTCDIPYPGRVFVLGL